ncbi:MAG: anti-sigma factor, partial [Pseudomonadota bacterium]|nr:anti-sigma factor [Pseudomonadota bacterium]
AIDYVVGTLRGAARRRYDALLPAHAVLREATRRWEALLMPLTAQLAPVQPSGDVWRRISDRIEGPRGAPEASALSRALNWWRGLAAVAGMAALALGVLVVNPRALPPPVVVVLAPTEAAAVAGVPGAIVASISGDGRSLVTRPIVPVAVRADRSLELWAVPTKGAPRSLGLLAGGNSTVVLRRESLLGADTLAVTVEPPGGGPDGKPTGPIVYAGKFTL